MAFFLVFCAPDFRSFQSLHNFSRPPNRRGFASPDRAIPGARKNFYSTFFFGSTTRLYILSVSRPLIHFIIQFREGKLGHSVVVFGAARFSSLGRSLPDLNLARATVFQFLLRDLISLAIRDKKERPRKNIPFSVANPLDRGL